MASIPHDALGMELSDSYVERTNLFALKNTFALGGTLCAVLLSMAASIFASGSIELQAKLLSYCSVALAVASTAFLLVFVQAESITIITTSDPPRPHLLLVIDGAYTE